MRAPFIIAALAELLKNEPPPTMGVANCRICGKTAKRDTGECDFCGTYECRVCGELFLGPPPHPRCGGRRSR